MKTSLSQNCRALSSMTDALYQSSMDQVLNFFITEYLIFIGEAEDSKPNVFRSVKKKFKKKCFKNSSIQNRKCFRLKLFKQKT